MIIELLRRTIRIPPAGDRGMFGTIQSESGFDVCESCISDVHPERDGGIGEAGGVVIAPNDVSELADGGGY